MTLDVPRPRKWARGILLALTVLAVLDNTLPQNPHGPRAISRYLPGPGLAEAGMLQEGGTLYVLWCLAAIFYVIAIWAWPPRGANRESIPRLLGLVAVSGLLLFIVGVMIFVMLLPTGSG
jgi:hypothetical protein